MSVEAHELMGDEWTRWQGHRVDGAFPLGRFLGSSAHGGAFLTQFDTPRHGQAAIKLLPASRAQEERQLSRWQRAGGLVHPHLLPLLKWGKCQLDGLPYLYVVMDYADQTLAQLLQRRALTSGEAREMLTPILEALAFLHGQGLIHGGLKPTNVLVVGDQLMLASDTIRRSGEDDLETPSGRDQPRDPQGVSSTAGDMRAMGISLFEALTRRTPPGAAAQRGSISLPVDFAPDFRDIVTRCLSPVPGDRPSATELLDWVTGRIADKPREIVPLTPLEAVISTPAQAIVPLPMAAPSQPAKEVTAPLSPRNDSKPRPVAAVIIAAVLIGSVWGGIRSLSGHRSPDALPIDTTVVLIDPMSLAEPAALSPGRTDGRAPSTEAPSKSEATETSALHEVIPVMTKNAARTIRGHVEISVQATVRPDGSVSAVAVDRSGRSQYFQRLAVQAAKKWTFEPASAASARVVQIQFSFSRDGAVGHAHTLQ